MSLLIKFLKLAGILAARLASKTVLTANGYIGIVPLINRQTQFKF